MRAGTGGQLGDFTFGRRDLRLIPLALLVGAVSTAIAVVLLALIGLVTNLAYYGRLSTELVQPPLDLGPMSVLIPVVGGLVIGIMARYGSERIRGHGIPEAMETILVGGSRVEPRLAVLKPISSAVSIGTGGPFGAEGPIILTGGAAGSLVGQSQHLSAAERRTLLVAGAAAGMTAVFGTPVAATLLGTELLLFEWRPRSLIPVGAAAAFAAALRVPIADARLLGQVPLFPMPAHPELGLGSLAGALVVGLAGGLLAWLLTTCVYGSEDLFHRLPVHWMWWPAVGGVIVGIGGLVDPRALGVGYDSIAAMLQGSLAVQALVSLLVVKLVIWSMALGSGTSGGILAPLLIIGGALGGILAPMLPDGSSGIWALTCMAATLAGVTRSPFTSVIFAVELTHEQGLLLPLFVACLCGYGVSVLVLRRSILTEKVARRGFHVMREYAVDPLEALFVRDVMATGVLTLEPSRPVADLGAVIEERPGRARQRLFPVVTDDHRVAGVVGRHEVGSALADPSLVGLAVRDIMRPAEVAFGDETLRTAADRMTSTGLWVMPVVDRDDGDRLLGLVAQRDLARARERLLVEERHRERVLRLRRVPIGRLPRRRVPSR
ncbi:MAG: chloride channel protein [Chloroflexota bacterium]